MPCNDLLLLLFNYIPVSYKTPKNVFFYIYIYKFISVPSTNQFTDQ